MHPDKLYSILKSYFGEDHDTRGDQFRVNCIKCKDTTRNLEISLTKGIFHCWVCEYRGHIKKLFKDISIEYVEDDEVYVSPAELKKKTLEDKKVEYITSLKEILPKEFIPLTNPVLSHVGQIALKYALSRMTKFQIEKYHVGYCGLGKYMWRIIVPVFENGKAIYFVARSFMNSPLPYKNPPAEDLGGLGKEAIVFNIDGARKHKRAILTEGVFDAIKVGEDGVAIFGTYLHDDQRKKLHGIPEIYVLLDEDAREKAIKIAEKIRGKNTRNVKIVNLPFGDPADFNTEDLRAFISKSKIFKSIDELR